METSPETWHPALWRASQLGRPAEAALPTGFAALDAELPGGGWPVRALTELLLPHAGVGELRLLAPALAAITGAPRSVICLDPPATPCGPALEQLGLDVAQVLLVRGREAPVEAPARPGASGASAAPGAPGARAGRRLPGTDALWALEQALASGQVGAALAWLPERLPPDALRRLQLAAQAHDGPVFLFRALAARARPSAAPLRLALQPAGADVLSVHVFKRRGPALAQPLHLELPPVLPPALRRRADALARARAQVRPDVRSGIQADAQAAARAQVA